MKYSNIFNTAEELKFYFSVSYAYLGDDSFGEGGKMVDSKVISVDILQGWYCSLTLKCPFMYLRP